MKTVGRVRVVGKPHGRNSEDGPEPTFEIELTGRPILYLVTLEQAESLRDLLSTAIEEAVSGVRVELECAAEHEGTAS